MNQPSGMSSGGWTRMVVLLGSAALSCFSLTGVGCRSERVDFAPGAAATPPGRSSSSRTTDSAVPTPAATPDTKTESNTADQGESVPSVDASKPTPPAAGDTNPTEGTRTEATTAEPVKPANHESPEASAKKPAARPVARRPSAPGEPLDISFDDLVIGMQADVVYRPWMLTDAAKSVDGQKVKLVGYVHPGVDKQKHIKELVLLRNTECKFGPGGQADHLVRVFFKTGVEGTFTTNAVEVQGVLKINPWQGADGNTWSLYDLEGTGFKDLRRK